MCERTFTACPGCESEVSDCLVYEVPVSFTRTYPVDEDGDPDYDCPDDADHDEDGGRLYCRNCGNYYDSGDLTYDAEPEDCDCDECEPVVDDPDEVVTLVRRANIECTQSLSLQALMIAPDKPPEIQVLLSDRTIRFIPIRRERADAIELWLESVGNRGEITVENRPPPRSHLALAVPEPEPELESDEPNPIIQLSMVEHNSYETEAE